MKTSKVSFFNILSILVYMFIIFIEEILETALERDIELDRMRCGLPEDKDWPTNEELVAKEVAKVALFSLLHL